MSIKVVPGLLGVLLMGTCPIQLDRATGLLDAWGEQSLDLTVVSVGHQGHTGAKLLKIWERSPVVEPLIWS